MGRLVLTESCVIQCAHGGTVQHPSSDSIRTIGGLKPNFTVDILGAPISGCPVPYTPCTCVAAISDAMTESNVVGASGTYALDVSGCQTDQGASLVVASRANSNSKTAKKASVNNSVEGEEGEEVPEHEKKKREEKERYNLYLLRKSTDNIKHEIRKPLRPSRPYIDVKYFYDRLETHPLISEKIVPFTLAFVYVKLADESIDEYRILSSGSLYGETFKDIQYKKEGEKDPYEYIPLYDGEKIEIAYSNVQLSSDQSKRAEAFSKLLTTEFDPTDTGKTKAESFFLKDPNAINSNRINLTTIKEQKKFDPVKAHEEKVKQAEAEGKSTDFSLYPLNSVVTIPDPFGEAEDMLNTYEWRYKKTFSANDLHINDMKHKNAYVYSVSNQIDFFYVDPNEQTTYNSNVLELKRLFREMADEVCQGDLAKLIVKGEDDITPLEEIINPAYDTAISYLHEVRYINRSFFTKIFDHKPKPGNPRAHREKWLHKFDTKRFEVHGKTLTCEYVPLIDFTSAQEINGKRRNRYDQKIGEYERLKTPKTHYDRRTGKTTVIPYTDIPYGYLVIDDKNELPKYENHLKQPMEMLALLVFSFFFSKHYEDKVKNTKAYESAKEFFYLLKNTQPLPPLSDDDRKDIQEVIKAQSFYSKVCTKENKLLEQYESMDDLNRTYSFDFTKIKSPNEAFSDLYIPKEFTSFLNDGNTNPKDMLTQVRKFIANNSDLKTLFETYIGIKEFDNPTQTRESVNTLLGMTYTLMENKTRLDVEADIISPFNNDVKIVRDMIKHTSLLQHKLEDPDLLAEIFLLPMHQKHIEVLQAHFGHALVDKTGQKQQTSQYAQAKALLDDEEFAPYVVQEEIYFDMSNFNNLFFEKKQEEQDLLKEMVAKFKAVSGYNANFATLTEGPKNKTHSKSVRSDDVLGAKGAEGVKGALSGKKFRKLKENKDFYKALKNYRKLSKNLSTIALLAGVASGYIRWDKLKGADKYNLMLDSAKLSAKIGESVLTKYGKHLEVVQKALDSATIKEIGSLKPLAKAGFIGVIIASAYEVEKLEKDDLDGQVVTVLKGVITLGIMLAPIGVVAATLMFMALEVAWALFSKTFVDTPLEAFIFKTLLFNIDEKTPYIVKKWQNFHNTRVQNPYEMKLLAHTVVKNGHKPLKGFKTPQEVQNFIGYNYKPNKVLFDDAMQYELNSLKAIVYGYEIELLETEKSQPSEKIAMTTVLLGTATSIKIPKEILQNNISVYVKTNLDRDYKNIYRGKAVADGDEPPMPTDFSYDIAASQKMSTKKMNELVKESDTYLLLINREIVFKYKVQYKIISMATMTSFVSGYTLAIDTLDLEPLGDKEKTMIQNDTYIDIQACEELTKQKQKAQQSA